MVNDGDGLRELSGLAVPRVGLLEATGDLFELSVAMRKSPQVAIKKSPLVAK